MKISLTDHNVHGILRNLVFASLCLLLVSLGMHKGVKIFLYASGISGALLFASTWLRDNEPPLPPVVLIPFVFLVYVLISPGTFFVDARLAGRFACALIAGMALQFFFSKHTGKILLTLCATCIVTILATSMYAALFAPELFQSRLSLTYGNPHRLAVAGAFSIITLVAYFDTFAKNRRPLIYGLVTILGAVIFLTVSRSTFLGLMSATAAYFLFYKAKHLLKFVVVACLLGATVFTILPDRQQERVLAPLTAPLQDYTIRQRVGIWYTTLQGITEAPILGHGLRAFSDYDEEYKNAHRAEMEEKNILIEDKRWSHPHSLYFGSVFGWGIVGTGLLLFAFVPAFRQTSGRVRLFFLLMTFFSLGYGVTELRIKSDDGAFYLFFPLGMAYGSILLDHYVQQMRTAPAEVFNTNPVVVRLSKAFGMNA